MFTLVTNIINQSEGGMITDYPLANKASTNPSTPVPLQMDIPILDIIPNQTVYYRTEAASDSCFHVVWESCITGHNLLMGLYPNTSYSGIIAQLGGWMILKPDVPRIMYLGLEPQTTETSTAYLGWESVSNLKSGAQGSGTLSSAEYVDAYEIHLDSDRQYDLNLTVPAGADCDLYIYYTNTSVSGYTIAYLPLVVQATIGQGIDESLTDLSPAMSGDYIVVVVCESGTGTYVLTFNCNNCPIPINPGMIFIGLLIGLLVYVKKGKKLQLST